MDSCPRPALATVFWQYPGHALTLTWWTTCTQSRCTALQVDLFRGLAGLLITIYFADLLALEGPFFGPDGVLDPTQTLAFNPWTMRWTLPVPARLLCYLGMLGGLLITIGVRPRLASAGVFLLCLTAYHRHYPVSDVDDYFMTILLAWLTVLPIGTSLTFGTVLQHRTSSIQHARASAVPAFRIHLFMANIALVYLVAGFWKWSSPCWRSGDALFIIEQMPAARFPAAWPADARPFLRPFCWAALIAEPCIPLLVWVARSRTARFIGLALAISLHVGIAATIQVPYVNLAMLAAMLLLSHPTQAPSRRCTGFQASIHALCSAYLLVVIVQASAAGIGLRALARPLVGGMQLVGLGQTYRLFDWVDDRAYRRVTKLSIEAHGTWKPLELHTILPDHIRTEILLSYFDGFPWKSLDPAFQSLTQQRVHQRICARFPAAGRWTLSSTMIMFWPHPEAPRRHSRVLMSGICKDSSPTR